MYEVVIIMAGEHGCVPGGFTILVMYVCGGFEY